MPLILFNQDGPIGKITLNNPEQLNAITPEMGDELKALIPQLNQKKELRVVLVTGTGKAFSAGGNLQFILDRTKRTPEQNKQDMIEFYSKFLSVRNLEVPSIAMINGPSIGAGFCLALACDIRYSSDQAKMGVNFAKLGLSSGMGGLYFVTKLLGPAKAADLFFSGRTLEASEAFQMGLLNRICSPENLEKETLAFANLIATNAPLPLKIMKKGLQKAVNWTLEEVFDYESSGQAQCFPTEDLKEGVRAIQEKRRPGFKGN
ncbi:MAG: enoyl-CoA hydratase/isomerase family protein [Deltaproteobacteria bacterium]|nr:enoyl-CoA hydratase/isomerase family protein [Deltaproteobacteria bacterium]